MRATTLFQAVLAIAMFSTGCSGDPSECKGPECETHTDCKDCTEPDVDTFLKVNVTTAGTPAPCNVNIDGEFAGPTGVLIAVPSNEEMTIQLGNIETMTSEDNPRPIHDLDGLRWVYPDIIETVDPGKTVEVTAPMNRFFDGTYTCSYDVYQWSYSTGDNKGDLFDTIVDPPQMISVVDGLHVQPDVGFSAVISGNGDNLDVVGDAFTLASDTWDLVSSHINANGSFKATVAENEFSVTDVSCMP